MKVLPKRNKLKSSIAHKMTDIITFLYKNLKYAIYTGGGFIDSIVIYKLLEPQLTWPIQVSPLVILVHRLISTII